MPQVKVPPQHEAVTINSIFLVGYRSPSSPTLLPPGIGIYTIHQPNDSVGTAQSHRNTLLSFLPSTRSGAGMTIYSRCVDTYALREKGWGEGRQAPYFHFVRHT